MLSIQEIRKIIKFKEQPLTDEEIKDIRHLLYFLANIELSNYQKNKTL